MLFILNLKKLDQLYYEINNYLKIFKFFIIIFFFIKKLNNLPIS